MLRRDRKKLSQRGTRWPVYSVAWSPDGKRVLTGSEDFPARVWDRSDRTGEGPPRGHTRPGPERVSGARTAGGSSREVEDNTGVCGGCSDGPGRKALPQGTHRAAAGVSWSPDSRAFPSREVRCSLAAWWDPQTGQDRSAIKGHTDLGLECVVEPRFIGSPLEVGDKHGAHGSLRRDRRRAPPQGRRGSLSVSWSPDGKHLLPGSGTRRHACGMLRRGGQEKALPSRGTRGCSL